MKKMTKTIEYSYWIGFLKTLKTNLVIWVPALLAFLAAVPVEYAPIASVIVYFLKNMYEVKTNSKLF